VDCGTDMAPVQVRDRPDRRHELGKYSAGILQDHVNRRGYLQPARAFIRAQPGLWFGRFWLRVQSSTSSIGRLAMSGRRTDRSIWREAGWERGAGRTLSLL